MVFKIKKLIKNLIPSGILNFYYKIKHPYSFSGDFKNWEQASLLSDGYDSNVILNKCRESLLKVKNSETVFERDSALFDKIQYSWPIITGLMHCIAENNKELHVLDFGGSLGSSYYQNKLLLSSINGLNMTWSIVEQNNFVICGKNDFTDNSLAFYETTEACFKERAPNVLLLSSVLQYLESPYEWLNKFLSSSIEYVIFDRTAFIKSSDDMILLQKVSSAIYKASYPTWVFDENKFLKTLLDKYDIILEHENTDFTNYKGMYFKGFVFKLKK